MPSKIFTMIFLSRREGNGSLLLSNVCGSGCGRIVSALVFEILSSCRGQFLLCDTLYSRSASLHPEVQMGTGELSGKPDEMLST